MGGEGDPEGQEEEGKGNMSGRCDLGREQCRRGRETGMQAGEETGQREGFGQHPGKRKADPSVIGVPLSIGSFCSH